MALSSNYLNGEYTFGWQCVKCGAITLAYRKHHRMRYCLECEESAEFRAAPIRVYKPNRGDAKMDRVRWLGFPGPKT